MSERTDIQRTGSIVSNLLFSGIGGVYLAVLTALILNHGQADPVREPINWGIVVLGAFPGFLLGLVVSYVRNAGKQLTATITRLEATVHEFEQLGVVDIIQTAKVCLDHYGPLKDILSAHGEQKAFARLLIDNAMEHYRSIPQSEPARFYELLIDGIKLSRNWEGIHQGSLELLGRDLPQRELGSQYVKALGDASKRHSIAARRVIILSIEEEDQLRDPDIMLPFWENTGRYVPSYWIPEERVKQMLGGGERELKLDDCALYDGRILLHYDRKERVITIAFDDTNNPIVDKLRMVFGQLDNWNSNPHQAAYAFELIDQKTVDAL